MIELLDVFSAEVPMRRPFVHASKARSMAESVLVRVTAGEVVGWGEGAPRHYVTGETMTSALEMLRALDVDALNRQIDWTSFDSSVRDIANLQRTYAPAPAAWTALEIALLDLVCRRHSRPLHDTFRLVNGSHDLLRERPEDTRVSFVLGLSGNPPASALERLPATTRASLRHVKIKVTSDIDDSIARVRAVRPLLHPTTTVSIDVNGAWPAAEVRRRVPDLAALQLGWIEEPTAVRDWDTIRRLREGGVDVMLDESFVDARDLEQAVNTGAATHVNLRVSKCGGVLATIGLAVLARSLGMRSQAGVQVGELGPLWAAGRAVGTSLRFAETVEAGRQDEWFGEPFTDPPYEVDRRRYRMRAVGGMGTGVVPNRALLRRLRPEGSSRALCSRCGG